MKKYKQLSQEQRYTIAQMLKLGKSKSEIALTIDSSVSTVYREINRNSTRHTDSPDIPQYRPVEAHRRCMYKHKFKPKKVSLNEPQMVYIRSKLSNERYSPELICVTGRAELGSFVSHETIYKWIWRQKRLSKDADRRLYIYLRHGHRKRKRGNQKHSRGIGIAHRIPIEQRPEIVNTRTRTGDIEVDFMIGKKQKQSVLVMTDRTTLFTKLTKLPSKDAPSVFDAIKRSISAMPFNVHTLTFDNDKSFSLHYLLRAELDIQTYFTHPYTAQDKGTVENRIGVIRRFIPKETDLLYLTYENVQTVEDLINNRPVRKFKYLSPIQKINS